MKSPNEEIISRLTSRGAEFIFGYEYVGKGDERKRVARTDKVSRFCVPLTSEEWCSLCMRKGDAYIGGCCGQTGYTQDILNNIFRDGGWIDSEDALDLIEVAGGHDGFEILTEKNEDALLVAEATWDKLWMLDKLFLCVAAAAPRICPSSLAKVNPSTREEPDDGIEVLSNALVILDYGDLWASDEQKESGQLHGNMMMHLARAVPSVE